MKKEKESESKRTKDNSWTDAVSEDGEGGREEK